MAKDILMIGGDMDFLNSIQKHFMNEAEKISYAESMEEALLKMQLNNYCLIILHLSIHKGYRPGLIATIRRQNPMPIFVLAENPSISEKVMALENGADDILEKPFAFEECLARIRALIRRYTDLNHVIQSGGEIICYDGLALDTGRRAVFINGKELLMPRKEYDILLYMLKNRWRTLTHEQLYEAVWKEIFSGDKSLVFFHMGQLRKLLGEGWIENVHGIGYRMCDRAI